MLDLAEARAAVAARLSPVPAGVPTLIFADNIEDEPTVGVPYLTWSMKLLTHTLYTMSPIGGHAIDTGRITFTYYGLSGVGAAAFDACMNALKALFESGTKLIASADTKLSVSWNPGPFTTGDITPLERAGFSYQQLIVPWNAAVRTTIAA